MTRAEAARELGINRKELKELETAGTAQPDLDERGWVDYTEDEVDRLRKLLAEGPEVKVNDEDVATGLVEGERSNRPRGLEGGPADPLTPQEICELRSLLTRNRRSRRVKAALDRVVEGTGLGSKIVESFRRGVLVRLDHPKAAGLVDRCDDQTLEKLIGQLWERPFAFMT